MHMRMLNRFSNPFLPQKKISRRRRFVIHLLSVFFSAGIFFILVFGVRSVLFPLPDKIEYATCISDDRGQIVHAFLPKDQHEILSKSHCNSVVTAVMT